MLRVVAIGVGYVADVDVIGDVTVVGDVDGRRSETATSRSVVVVVVVVRVLYASTRRAGFSRRIFPFSGTFHIPFHVSIFPHLRAAVAFPVAGRLQRARSFRGSA